MRVLVLAASVCGWLVTLCGCGGAGDGRDQAAATAPAPGNLKAMADLTREQAGLFKRLADGAAPSDEEQKQLRAWGERMDLLVAEATKLDPKADRAKFQREADRLWLAAVKAHAPDSASDVERILKRRNPQAETASATVALGALRAALQAFFRDSNRYPSDQEGIEALWKRPEQAQRWNGPYLAQPMPSDPWGNAWKYRTDAERGYVLESLGADGKPGSGDEITVDSR